MKTTFQTITGRDVHHNAVLFLYNHANAWDTQTIRNECLQSKWRSLSDFAVMARWIQDVIFIRTCVARWGDNQWKEMLISIFSCFTWSQIPPIAAGAPSCQPHLIFLLSQQPNTNAIYMWPIYSTSKLKHPFFRTTFSCTQGGGNLSLQCFCRQGTWWGHALGKWPLYRKQTVTLRSFGGADQSTGHFSGRDYERKQKAGTSCKLHGD